MELVKDRTTKERACEEAEIIMYKCMSKGLSFKLTMGNILTFCPPLIVTEAELRDALKIVEESIEEVER